MIEARLITTGAGSRARSAVQTRETLENEVAYFTNKTSLTSKKQRIILGGIEGKSNAEIATEAGISPGTVKSHIFELYRYYGGLKGHIGNFQGLLWELLKRGEVKLKPIAEEDELKKALDWFNKDQFDIT